MIIKNKNSQKKLIQEKAEIIIEQSRRSTEISKKTNKKNNQAESKKNNKKTRRNNNNMNPNLKKTTKYIKKKSKKKINGGGLLTRLIPNIGTILSPIANNTSKSAVTQLGSNLITSGITNFTRNALLDVKDFKTYSKLFFNIIVRPSFNGAYFTVSTLPSFVFNGLFQNISSSQLATLGMGAGISSLGALYFYAQKSQKRIKIDEELIKERNKRIVSNQKEEFVKLSDITMEDFERTDYYDEKLLYQYENDPYYSFRQHYHSQNSNQIKNIYESLKTITHPKYQLEYVDKIKKLKDLIILIKKQPYLLKEYTNLCFSNTFSSNQGIPLLFCIFNTCGDIRIIKLILSVYESSTMRISNTDSILDQVKSSKYQYSVLDYLLSRKITEKNDNFKKIEWLSSALNYTSISYQTIILFFKYMRIFYGLQIYKINKQNPHGFNFHYTKLQKIRTSLIDILNTLLLKYSQNMILEQVDIFDVFLETLKIEKNTIPLDVQIIECLIMNNFDLKIKDDKDTKKYELLKRLNYEKLHNQNGLKVINKYNEQQQIGKDIQFDYGQVGIRLNSSIVTNGDSSLKIEIEEDKTTGLYCELTSHINYHFHKFKRNSMGVSITPYILFPISEQEMKYEYMNVSNINHHYSKFLILQSKNKLNFNSPNEEFLDYLQTQNKTFTRVFSSLEAAVRDSHYHQVYFLNKPFTMTLVNNFIIYVKKTRSSYVKVALNVNFRKSDDGITTQLVSEKYYFWVLRSDIDFKYLNIDDNDEFINNITKEKYIIKDKQLLKTTGIFELVRSFFGFKNQNNLTHITSYKDVNIVIIKNINKITNENNIDNVMVLFFPNLTNRDGTKDSFTNMLKEYQQEGLFYGNSFDQVIQKSSSFLNRKRNYLYLENGDFVLLRKVNDQVKINEIIKDFLKSKNKKNLIIPRNCQKNLNKLLQTIAESIDDFYIHNYVLISQILSKSIFIVDTKGEFESGNKKIMEDLNITSSVFPLGTYKKKKEEDYFTDIETSTDIYKFNQIRESFLQGEHNESPKYFAMSSSTIFSKS